MYLKSSCNGNANNCAHDTTLGSNDCMTNIAGERDTEFLQRPRLTLSAREIPNFCRGRTSACSRKSSCKDSKPSVVCRQAAIPVEASAKL